MIQVGEIDKGIVRRYLGIKSEEPDEVMEKLINEAIEMVKKDAVVAYVCDIQDIVRNDEGIGFEELSLVLKGEDIKKHLEGSEKAILMCATLSQSIDTRIRSLQIKNMPLALVYDAVASVAIDSVCDEICDYVNTQVPGYVQTSRFSPGYGDLPLELQPEFIACLNATKRAGVSVTAGNMLAPTKSITAVVGMRSLAKYLEGHIEGTLNVKEGCGTERTCSKCKHSENCKISAARKE